MDVVEVLTLANLRLSGGRGDMEDIMTDVQFKTILEMIGMILDGCEDLEEAKKKIQKLLETQNKIIK